MQATASSNAPRLVKTKTPGIYRKGNRYVVVFRDPSGRQRKRFAPTLAAARDLKATLTADVKRGEWRAQSRVRFDEYAVEWIANYTGRTSRGLREETRANYRRGLGFDTNGDPTGDGALAFFGRMKLAEIEPRDVKRYLSTVAARGVARDTVRLALAPVRALFATAVEEGILRFNPATGIRLPRIVARETDDTEHMKALTEKELLGLLKAVPSDWRLFVEFLAHTGLRISEALALRWQDLDFGRRRVLVRRRYYRGSFAAPKSNYGRREVPLSQGMAQRLWELRKGTTISSDDTLVFSRAGGEPFDASTPFRIVKAAAREAGVPWAGLHTLRHTCATRLFRNGLNAKQVQLWLGHHSPAFTLATYVHLLPDDLPDPVFLDAVASSSGFEIDAPDDGHLVEQVSGQPVLRPRADEAVGIRR